MKQLSSLLIGSWLSVALLGIVACGRSSQDSQPAPDSTAPSQELPQTAEPKLSYLLPNQAYRLQELLSNDIVQLVSEWEILSGSGRLETNSQGTFLTADEDGKLVLIGRKSDGGATTVTLVVSSHPKLSLSRPLVEKSLLDFIPARPGEKVSLSATGGVPELKVCRQRGGAAKSSAICTTGDLSFKADEDEGYVEVWLQDGVQRQSNSLFFVIQRKLGDLSYRFGEQGELSLVSGDATASSKDLAFAVAPDQKTFFITRSLPAAGPGRQRLQIEKRDGRGALVPEYGNQGIAILEGDFESSALTTAVDSQGRLFTLVEKRSAGGLGIVLMALDATGKLDNLFSREGVWELPGVANYSRPSLHVLQDDSILVAYTIDQRLGLGLSDYATRLTRLDSSGSPDTTFGQEGHVDIRLQLNSRKSISVDESRGLIHVTGSQFVPKDSPLSQQKITTAAYARIKLQTGEPVPNFGKAGLLLVNVDYRVCCLFEDFKFQTALFYLPSGQLAVSLADRLFLYETGVPEGLEQITIGQETNPYFLKVYSTFQVGWRKLFARASSGTADFIFRRPDGKDWNEQSPIEAMSYSEKFSAALFKESNSKVNLKTASGEAVPWWFDLSSDSELLVLDKQLLVTLPNRIMAFNLEPSSLLR